ncbi:polysaccharide deacetylase family protein [Campylobacter lari]|uniref:polysaccharide deacetylase family protein n=1 Tax=Campylobacter lari TaxID=201 RepID=UPI000E121D84|nr:polysaccharide deacetylase family protein [Campylobacter lari]SUX05514.1 polysaccharide deacetylase [Campylobacter lari]
MKVIMYHYVRNSNKKFPYFRYLSVDSFKKQLDYFEKEFGFVDYEDFLELCDKSSDYKTFERVKGKILLTFDDGFIDHFKFVMPELLKRDTFGLFFIPTGVYQRKKALDVHRIHYLIGRYGGRDLIKIANSLLDENMLEKVDYFKEKTYTKQDNDFYTSEFKKLFNYYIKYEFRESFLDEIMLACDISDEEIFSNLYMSENELKEMHDNGMILGSHSVDHLVFSKLKESEQITQIKHSFDFLENLLGKLSIKSFCYPYGGYHTFTDFTEKILTKYGCNFSFNVESRDTTLDDIKSRPQALPRYDCNEFDFGRASLG